jgi:hypothetical protein
VVQRHHILASQGLPRGACASCPRLPSPADALKPAAGGRPQASCPEEGAAPNNVKAAAGSDQSTRTRAVPPIPIASAAARDRSMQRPGTKGPRSDPPIDQEGIRLLGKYSTTAARGEWVSEGPDPSDGGR